MKLPERYNDLAARCDPWLSRMGMPVDQREEHIADLIGLVGQILDGYFHELSPDSDKRDSDNHVTCSPHPPASSTSASRASARSETATDS